MTQNSKKKELNRGPTNHLELDKNAKLEKFLQAGIRFVNEWAIKN